MKRSKRWLKDNHRNADLAGVPLLFRYGTPLVLKGNVPSVLGFPMDFQLVDVNGHPRIEWMGEGAATAGAALTLQNVETRGGCCVI